MSSFIDDLILDQPKLNIDSHNQKYNKTPYELMKSRFALLQNKSQSTKVPNDILTITKSDNNKPLNNLNTTQLEDRDNVQIFHPLDNNH